jgi:hypothetical protein
MNLLTLVNGIKTFVSRVDFIDFANSAFRIRLTGTATADRTITLPNDTGTVLLDDRPIGSVGGGVSLRGYEPIVTVTANKTLALTDAGTVQDCRNTATATITIPLNSAVAFPIGTRIVIKKTTAQTVSVALTGGVNILTEGGGNSPAFFIQQFCILRKTATDTWTVEHPIPSTYATAVFFSDLRATTLSPGANSTVVATTAFTANEINNLSKIRYLFVIAGESNAGGKASNNLTPDQLQPQSQCQIWNNTTATFQSLQIGVNNLIGHTGIPDNSLHGIERGLSRDAWDVLALPEIYLVKAGQGASTIAQWSVGNATGYLATLTSRYNAARAAMVARGFTVRPVFIWMQGINDAEAITPPATWRTATQAHFTQIRTLMGTGTPILFPKIMPTNANYIAINTEIDTIDTADTALWSVPSSTVSPNPVDLLHYTASGYIQIAEMVVDTFRRNVGVQGSLNAGPDRNTSTNRPVVSVRRSAALSIPHNTATQIVFDTIDADSNNIYSVTTGAVTIPANKGGLYSIQAMATISAASNLRVQVLVNNVLRAQSPLTDLTTNSIFSGELSRLIRFNAGDNITISVLQLNTVAAALGLFTQIEYQAVLNIFRISD